MLQLARFFRVIKNFSGRVKQEMREGFLDVANRFGFVYVDGVIYKLTILSFHT